MSKKIEVGVLGATGMVGQSFVNFLEGHPWFELTWAGASDRSAGKKYRDATSWRLDGSMPARVSDLTVEDCKPGNAPKLLFSAMDAAVATDIERAFAEAGHTVVSNSKNHRMESDVPLLVPEVNPDHLGILPVQHAQRKWRGQIVTNPNCVAIPLAMALGPLRKFGIERAIVTTMQAVSGAGYPGVPSMDILGNVIPFIGGEEEKIEQETKKILGSFESNRIDLLPAKVSAHCNRVASVDGHMITVSLAFQQKVELDEVREALRNFRSAPQERRLPSAPCLPIHYLEEENRPQPRRDGLRERGMAVSVGRLRPCEVLDYKFVCLGHNTIRGAAGAAVLNAELMHSGGQLDR